MTTIVERHKDVGTIVCVITEEMAAERLSSDYNVYQLMELLMREMLKLAIRAISHPTDPVGSLNSAINVVRTLLIDTSGGPPGGSVDIKA